MYSVEFENVTEKFKIYHRKSLTLKNKILGTFLHNKDMYETFLALDDVSFKVENGQTFGIIGENGSGKSTILKLVTQILKPDGGQVKVNGKVSALLELGAGFHYDLTGRENAYLNGSIMGLSRKDIDEKFNDIMKFADIDKFIDTPVRTYSSGMFVRLGFAIAVNVNPDILVIDEALAVGDQNFQQKSFNKIVEFKKNGKTIIFVSHNLDAVEGICDKVMWINEGKIKMIDDTRLVLRSYNEYCAKKGAESTGSIQKMHHVEGRKGSGEVVIKDVTFHDKKGELSKVFQSGEPASIRINYIAKERIKNPVIGVALWRDDGTYVFGTNTKWENHVIDYLEGENYYEIHYPKFSLIEGKYKTSVAIFKSDGIFAYDFIPPYFKFEVKMDCQAHGVFIIDHTWRNGLKK
jgi:ABC-type polysaccharide/polyol phosphate transport system ATPase subunit